jgi:hypothetical protein
VNRARWPIVVGVVNCGLVTTVAVSLLLADKGPADAVQPIEFNHSIHVAAEVECLMCHEGILDRSESRLPTLDTCTTCHDGDADDHPELARLAQYVEAGTELAWDPLLRLPDHVFFPHVRHVNVAGFECVECHADMPKRTSPPTHRRTVSMAACVGCHERHDDSPSARRASLDCGSCHR